MKAKEFVGIILDNTPFTQSQLANCLGVDQSLISKWKSGERDMTAIQFTDLCNVLGYSTADYLNGVTGQVISFAFSASGLSNEDILSVGRFNKLLANLNYMEMIESNESRN